MKLNWRETLPTVVASVAAAALIGSWVTTVEMRDAVTKLVTTVERVIMPQLADHEARLRNLEQEARKP